MKCDVVRVVSTCLIRKKLHVCMSVLVSREKVTPSAVLFGLHVSTFFFICAAQKENPSEIHARCLYEGGGFALKLQE